MHAARVAVCHERARVVAACAGHAAPRGHAGAACVVVERAPGGPAGVVLAHGAAWRTACVWGWVRAVPGVLDFSGEVWGCTTASGGRPAARALSRARYGRCVPARWHCHAGGRSPRPGPCKGWLVTERIVRLSPLYKLITFCNPIFFSHQEAEGQISSTTIATQWPPLEASRACLTCAQCNTFSTSASTH